jgi:hypothetical protein
MSCIPKAMAMKKINILPFFTALGVPVAAYIDKLTGPKERITHFRVNVFIQIIYDKMKTNIRFICP